MAAKKKAAAKAKSPVIKPKEFYALADASTGRLIDSDGDPLDVAVTRKAMAQYTLVANGHAIVVGPFAMQERRGQR